ncbi:MAG: purine-nucleoside phosphorylase [Chloroflexi bacterium GWB2_49_20]|nr:MAG: purine-nucleoside phosphorylase [Chloroflexi bacterium GWB2_49_20]OGN78231.1 MAG: purine-nucleoside phosphorylase [Chloroflexi bacterium GWC2_49_37]OGN85267.1 MAG: purine-nucleoside phosphorylase [Chloroflexi bacterium GWD2_49_16]
MERTLSGIERLAGIIHSKWAEQLQFGIILGSGLGGVAESVQNGFSIPYNELPGWPLSTVIGHAGRLIIGQLENKNVLVMQGRIHFYEGYSMQVVTMPIRVMQRLGIKDLIVTNAAGGVNPSFVPGDVMMITDHLNLMGMAGQNPLSGPNLEEFGPRFPDMSQAYDRDLMKITRSVSKIKGINLREGVYAGLSGPSFETPADLRFLRAVGVDAVGMSTVPEVTVARHGSMRVLGFSGISNKANLNGSTKTTHEEVLEAGRLIAPKIEAIIHGVLSVI